MIAKYLFPLILLLTPVTPLAAATTETGQACRLQTVEQMVEQARENDIKIEVLTDVAVATLNAKAGEPPVPYTHIVLFTHDDLGMIGIIDGECLQVTSKPFPIEGFRRDFLGERDAAQ